MKIEYTYKEPKEIPIEKAKFNSSGGMDCEVYMMKTYNGILFNNMSYNKSDLADLIALLQRFHKQLPKVEG